MNKAFNAVWIVAMAALLSACVPSTNIKQPLTARPVPKAAAATESNGSIFQAGVNERPMFEDRRARNVGDVLIINIVETTSASGKSGSSADNSGSIGLSTPTVTSGSAGGVTQFPLGMSADTAVKSASKSDSSGSNSFSGAITVTVTEVLPNGNLRVAGEKQVAIKHSEEYVRFSGVVNPSNISSSNTVQSTQVAEVHVEYKGAQNLDAAAVTTMFNRFFFSILPF
ncbi:MAG: flagellar basal body L-ring protein FlgH [Nitrosomonadales bacterium]|nr:flagellar basal body L-ring protein FlgH [Nitrosomonadales bacterium]